MGYGRTVKMQLNPLRIIKNAFLNREVCWFLTLNQNRPYYWV
jgi:hypothetical protein